MFVLVSHVLYIHAGVYICGVYSNARIYVWLGIPCISYVYKFNLCGDLLFTCIFWYSTRMRYFSICCIVC